MILPVPDFLYLGLPTQDMLTIMQQKISSLGIQSE
jgi:hypothetical protein